MRFRWGYAEIGRLLTRWAPAAQRLALTATATAEQLREIAAALGMDQPRIIVAPMLRPELRMRVVSGGDRAVFDQLLRPWSAATPSTPGPV